MESFLVTIEFRYSDKPDSHDSTSRNKKVTIGVYDTFDEACIGGNKLMETLESKFPLHVFPNGRGTAKKERFSKNGGCFGSKHVLISNLAYLKTPFVFYAKITTLKKTPVDDTINSVVNSVNRYKEYKNNCE
jgi:hypothetical protein